MSHSHSSRRDVRLVVRLVLMVIAIYALRVPGSAGRLPQGGDWDEIRKIQEAAHQRPGDPAAFEAYLKTLPRFGEDFVVEGDLLMTRDEVFIHLVSRSQTASPVTRPGELLVSLRNGRPEIYPPAQRTLTYAVDRNSFPDAESYQIVVANVKAAALEWEQIICDSCDVKFVHRPEHDSRPSNDKVSFTVRVEEIPLIALAFFPFDPPEERLLRIAPRYFRTKYDPIGVTQARAGAHPWVSA